MNIGQPELRVRNATAADLDAIAHIYNEGIEDRIATLDEDAKTADDIAAWWEAHQGRYAVLVAENAAGDVIGWASLNPYSHRCAYDGVADLSIYIERGVRGTGVGSLLLCALEKTAKANDFHKIVLFTFTFNAGGQGLYRKLGYREVGTFHEMGKLDGRFVDVMAMEKILVPPSRPKPPGSRGH
jgi:phosphinothricin acetyltransferase